MTLGTRRRLTGLLALAAVLAALLQPVGAAAAPSVVTLSLDKPSATRGAKVTASGTIAPPSVEARKVVLQRAVPGGWTAVAEKTIEPPGVDYQFTVPTSFYGSFAYRVVAKPTTTVDEAASDQQPLKVKPPYTPRGKASSHSFLVKPVARWNPCTKIHYRVNDSRARSGALRDVKQAIQRIRYATGLPLVYAGKTRKVPTGRVGDRYPAGTELVIAWARPAATNMLGAGATVAGRGGPIYSSGYQDGAGNPAYLIKQGGVVLNANLNSRIRGGFGTGQTRGELVMHEVGHALGLGHTGARGQIMYPVLQSGIARFEAGDLAGLNRVGAQQGCLVHAFARSGRSVTPRTWSLVSR